MGLVRALFTACVLLLSPSLADAASIIRADVTARAIELTNWIVARTDYTYKAPPPIVYLRHRAMVSVHGSDTIQAMYFPNMMVLRDDFLIGRDDDTLLHELVHHLQFKHGNLVYEIGACYAAAEQEAYRLQIEWVKETGIGRMPDALFLATLTCGVL